MIFAENNLKSTNLSIRRAASIHGNTIFVSTVSIIGLGNQINYDSPANGILILAIGPREYNSLVLDMLKENTKKTD